MVYYVRTSRIIMTRKQVLWTLIALVLVIAGGCATFQVAKGTIKYTSGDKTIEVVADSLHATGIK